jgi:DeoR family glycerol-3-phosphate regulon repressor
MKHQGLRIITNNLNVASIMSSNPEFEVIVAGGFVRARDRGIVGEATVDLIAQFKVDFGIIGISGIDHDGTLLDFDYREVRVAQAIMDNSHQIFLATDHSKFGRDALVRLAHLSQIDALFTDRPPPAEMRDVLDAANLTVFLPEAGDAAAA